jgi:hypothetical protein
MSRQSYRSYFSVYSRVGRAGRRDILVMISRPHPSDHPPRLCLTVVPVNSTLVDTQPTTLWSGVCVVFCSMSVRVRVVFETLLEYSPSCTPTILLLQYFSLDLPDLCVPFLTVS